MSFGLEIVLLLTIRFVATCLEMVTARERELARRLLTYGVER